MGSKNGGSNGEGNGNGNGKKGGGGNIRPQFNRNLPEIQTRHKYQQPALQAIQQGSPLTVITGTAGSGKTFVAVWTAMKALKEKKVRQVILTRPAVEAAGENLGFLPGDAKEKLYPYMQPFFHILKELNYTQADIDTMQESGVLEIAPIAFMRGRTFTDAFIICDEAQNATESQIQLVYSRLGRNSQMVFTGDPLQSDLMHDEHGQNAFQRFADFLERNRDRITAAVVRIPPGSETYRHPIIAQIERARLIESGHPEPANDSSPDADAEATGVEVVIEDGVEVDTPHGENGVAHADDGQDHEGAQPA